MLRSVSRMMFRWRWLLSSVILALLLSSCASVVEFSQPDHTDYVRLQSGETIGQTFHARFSGLQAVVLNLKRDPAGTGNLVFTLHPAAGSDAPKLAEFTLPLAELPENGFQRFRFPALKGSAKADYYLQVSLEGQGNASFATAPASAYSDGAMYQNGTPRTAQLNFRLIYDPRLAWTGIMKETALWLGWLAAAVWLFLVPGWSLLGVFLPGWRSLSAGEKAGISTGLSLAIYPLILLWGRLLGLKPGMLLGWLLPFLCLILFGIVTLLRRRAGSSQPESASKAMSRLGLSDIALLVVLAMIFFTRMWPVRDLAAPMFGDSYQHTVITQLLIDHNGLFDSWQPYAELTTFTYHFGFHAAALVFHSLTRLPADQAVLWLGQLLNLLAAFSLYPLAVRLSGNRWGGVLAVLVAGLFTPVLMDYTNWGRYPQLTGQVILPAAAWLIWELLETRQKSLPVAVLSGVVLGGLALTHFRVLAFAVVFAGVSLLFHLPRRRQLQKAGRMILSTGIAGFLFFPWFLHAYAGKMMGILSHQLAVQAPASASATQSVSKLGNLFDYLPAWLWLLLPVLLAWGLWRREKKIALISLWWLINLVAANPQWLNLPGAGAITSFAVLIAAYIPASLIAGAAFSWIIEAISASPKRLLEREPAQIPPWVSFALLRAFPVLGLVLLVAVSAFFARQRLEDIDPDRFALVTHADLRAAEWVRASTPADARFVVNAFSAFDGYSVVGSDAGWWLPILAQRATNLPPINYSFEQGPSPDFREQVNSLVGQIVQKGISSPETHAALVQRGYDFIFVGQRQGKINNPGVPVLEPVDLRASPNYRLVYHQDLVWIFEILPAR